MPEWAVNLIELAITALIGGGGGYLVSRYKAKTDRIDTIADARVAAEKSTTEAWQTLTQSLQERLAIVTDRLCDVEKQLAIERNRYRLLENKIAGLERERDQWILERQRLILQIAEMGGGGDA